MLVEYMQGYGEELSSKWMHISAEGSSEQSSIDTLIGRSFLESLSYSFARASERKLILYKYIVDTKMVQLKTNLDTLYVKRKSAQPNEIIALATSYYNLGMTWQECTTEASNAPENALTFFTRSLELLEEVDLDCNAILIAVKALLAMSVLIRTKCNRLIKSGSLAVNEDRRCLYTAIILCILYIEHQNFPRPICKYLADVSEEEDLRLLLISLFKDMIKHIQTYYSAPTDMDEWIKNVHNLLNNWISSINSLNEAYQWSDFAISISLYFMKELRFTEARNSLAATEYILKRELSTTNIDNFDKNKIAAVADAWLRYAEIILRLPFWRLQAQQEASSVPNQEAPQELLLFNGSLGEHLAGFSNRITNLYISNFYDAYKVYAFAVEKYLVANDIYADLHFYSNHIAAACSFISILTYFAYFTTDMNIQIKIHKDGKAVVHDISDKYTQRTSYDPDILLYLKKIVLLWMNYIFYIRSAIEGNRLYDDFYSALEMELQFISFMEGIIISRVEEGATNL